MLGSAITASWAVPFAVFGAAARLLGFSAAAAAGGRVAVWLLVASTALAVGSLLLSAVAVAGSDPLRSRQPVPPI
ncbi:MAG TPA: hypothetical protein VMW35_12725 [Myxococcota bacterium]|jgi:hypothetical protein|nr:hypothetical protein [Myxococcota bacterium]